MAAHKGEFFLWRAEQQVLLPVVSPSAPDRLLGYELTCPVCHRKSFLNTGMGARPEHRVTHDAVGRLMVRPSVQCPFLDCTFHVIIHHGVATLERRHRDSAEAFD